MVLFEKDGMSFYTSTDLKSWTWQSHFMGLHECPDFFELPVDGDNSHRKWILHGGSSTYFIGSFDGSTFTPETSALRYAEGKNANGDDILYAAQSFADMPDGRRCPNGVGKNHGTGHAVQSDDALPNGIQVGYHTGRSQNCSQLLFGKSKGCTQRSMLGPR